MSQRSLHELTKIVGKAAKAIFDREKFAVPYLASRARKLAQAFPHDQTCVHMSNFLTRRATNTRNDQFISRAEFIDVYNKLYTNNNKFVEHFSDELGSVKAADKNTMLRDPKEGESLVSEAYENISDPILQNALKSVFDENTQYKPYSEYIAKQAQKACVHELNCCGAFPKKIDVVAGQSDVLICRAAYETPNGENFIIIPVEVKNNKALMPSVFLGEHGFVNISADNIRGFLKRAVGHNVQVNVQQLLNVISGAKNGIPDAVGEVEMAIMKAKALTETPAHYDQHGILEQKVDDANPNVELPRYEEPEEVQSFAKHLESPYGAAEFKFGKNIVSGCGKRILNAVTKMGFDKTQVAVSDSNDDTIFYAVTLAGQKGFKVPVKLTDGNPSAEMIIAASGVYPFSKNGIDSFLQTNSTDSFAVAQTSQVYGTSPSELLEVVRTAMNEGNYLKAEDALNVLRHSDDITAFNTAFSIYMNNISKKAGESDIGKCQATIKTASSKYLLCSHTGLPVHKTYVDKYGDCQPLYRKAMEESGDGKSFSYSKIKMG